MVSQTIDYLRQSDAYSGHRDRAFRRIVTDAHVVVLRG